MVYYMYVETKGDMVRYGMVCMVRHGIVWYVVQCVVETVWYGMVWYGMVCCVVQCVVEGWYGMVWYAVWYTVCRK